MTFHKLALATILTSATALGAYAQDNAIEDNAIEEKGHEMENAARADEAPGIDESTDYDAESYGIRGDEVVSVGPEQDATEQGVNDDVDGRFMAGKIVGVDDQVVVEGIVEARAEHGPQELAAPAIAFAHLFLGLRQSYPVLF